MMDCGGAGAVEECTFSKENLINCVELRCSVA